MKTGIHVAAAIASWLFAFTLSMASEPAAIAEKKSLTLDGAKQVAAAAAAAEARAHNEGGAIAVVGEFRLGR